ncbi:hypothetical protein, partial [Actinomadura rubrisoli]|uniref:hypothetical protein n=1 Tax=Actinomadura rubrisoli TaxID=2530368 RepID=UPI001FB7436D
MDARAELRTLPKDLATRVARHLVMAGKLAEDEPEQAYKHARAARRLASRVGIVREAAGLAAYHAGDWAEALAELRAARRLSAGDASYLPVMVDCERGLGRPERALDLLKSPEAGRLDPMGTVELRIVESGVRRDLGQYDAAVVTLQVPELRDRRLRPWSARLFYAYADALAAAGREDEASDWFARSAAADRDGDTDAAERYAELEGLHILDTEDDEVEDVEDASAVLPTTDATEGQGGEAPLPEAGSPAAIEDVERSEAEEDTGVDVVEIAEPEPVDVRAEEDSSEVESEGVKAEEGGPVVEPVDVEAEGDGPEVELVDVEAEQDGLDVERSEAEEGVEGGEDTGVDVVEIAEPEPEPEDVKAEEDGLEVESVGVEAGEGGPDVGA